MGNIESTSASLQDLPKTALQAIYHAVTGKVENLQKSLLGNVIVRSKDIDLLYQRILDQLEHYDLLSEPTTTVVIKTSENQSYTYSSWARYKKLSVNNHSVTSEVSIKVEFVAQLPNTNAPQRCVIAFSIDSSLPVLNQHAKEPPGAEFYNYIIFTNNRWRAVEVSIDFVDFLIAKRFCSIIEEWFDELPKTPQSKINIFMIKTLPFLRSVSAHLGRFGMGIFIASYLSFSDGNVRVADALNIAAIGLPIWAIFSVMSVYLTVNVRKRVASNIIPTVVLTTDRDEKDYSSIRDGLSYPFVTLVTTMAFIFANVAVNISSSYIYENYLK